MLAKKNIVLGVTGGIAAYKAVDLASQLTQAGATVRVIMTESAVKMVAPHSFWSVTQRPVTTAMFDTTSQYSGPHVALGSTADIMVVAPATANTIAKMAWGISDNVLCATVLATKAPVVVAPAMNVNMWENQATQENVARLKARGVIFVGPVYGRLADGKRGAGRFVETREIIGVIKHVLGRNERLAGKTVIVTAGGTQEPIDPVRCITNRSSGKMGYAIAEAARDHGARVVLITAPTGLPAPVAVETVPVNTAQDMFQAVQKAAITADVLIMAAAVADYRPVQAAGGKIKRQKSEKLSIELERTPDILGGVTGKFLRVGFAAETENLEANARDKLARKSLDLIVANDVSADHVFGSDTNRVIMIDRTGAADSLPVLPKAEVAEKIVDRVIALLKGPGVD